MASKTISTFNGVTQVAGAGTSLIVAPNSLPIIQSLYGYCNGTANTQYFLQFFNSATVPADTTVPLLSLQVLGGNGFGPYNYVEQGKISSLFSSGDNLVAADGLIICLSTTEATLTIGTGDVTMDLQVEIESGEVPVLGQTKVSGSAVALLQVMADPSTSKLVRFKATNNSGGVRYLMLFGYTAPVNGATPVQQWKVADGTTLNVECGGGFPVQQGDPITYQIHTGIYLYGSSETQIFNNVGPEVWDIDAYYI